MGEAGLKGGPGLLMEGGRGSQSCTSSWSAQGLGRNADSGLGIEHNISHDIVTHVTLVTLMEEVTRNLGITVP